MNLLLAKLLLWIHIEEVVCRGCLGAVYGWRDEFRYWEGVHKVQAGSTTSSGGFTHLESWPVRGIQELTVGRSQGAVASSVFSRRRALHIGSDSQKQLDSALLPHTHPPTHGHEANSAFGS